MSGSGNSRQRYKKRRRQRAKYWDVLALKASLLPDDTSIGERLIAMNLKSTGGNRKRLTEAMTRQKLSVPNPWLGLVHNYLGAPYRHRYQK